MLRSLSDAVLGTMARWRPRVRRRDTTVKVNLGAGIEVARGWINVDGSIHALVAGAPRSLLSFVYRRTHNVRRLLTEDEYIRRLTDYDFIFCDFANGLPFEDDSVDFIFCSHVLEHFWKEDAARLLKEMRRVLKPGGLLRICVPDLARAMALYQEGDAQGSLRYFFTGERSSFDQHRYMYDFGLLADLLKSEGFSEITKRSFQQGLLPDLGELDNRPDETLYVEAANPLN